MPLNFISNLLNTASNLGQGITNTVMNSTENKRQRQIQEFGSDIGLSMLQQITRNSDPDNPLNSLHGGAGKNYKSGVDYITPYITLENEKRSADTHDMVKDLAYNGVQRRVEDLKKAGLSPILAAGDAASSSVTSQNTSGSGGVIDNSYFPSSVAPSVLGSSTFGNPEISAADVRLKNAEARKLEVDADTKEEYEQPNIKADIDLKKSQTLVNHQTIKEIEQRTYHYMEQINLTKAQQNKVMEEVNALIHNNSINSDYGIRSQDSIPITVYQLNGILNSLGIDTNSNAGQFLSALLSIYVLSRGSAPRNINKSTNTYNSTYKGNTFNKGK